MRAGALVAIACSGCSSILGIGDFKLNDDAGNTGNEMMMLDASPDAAPGCLGPAGFMVCLVNMPMQDVTFGPANGVVNTDTDPACLPMQPPSWKAANQADACIIVARTITIDFLNASGSRPLVLFATDRIAVNGTLDVAARRGSTLRPPGAPSGACTQPLAAMESGGGGGGGGAGGTFMVRGGDGGNGESGVAAGGRAALADPTKPVILRAGCNGGTGAKGTDGMIGPPGTGGGAIFLVAGNRIDINGTINASGAGGSPGGMASGGGGGGAGGMILLHSQMLITSATAQIFANGGGGAGGSANNLATPGQDATQALQPAPGGGGAGVPGGLGFAGTIQASAGQDGNFQRGGGGGGGGGGYIRSNQAFTTGAVSPSPSIEP